MSTPRAFAEHGSDKMIYDLRMGPQGIWHHGAYYAVWQGASTGDRAHPHIARWLPDSGWSRPRRLGTVTGTDHHFAPILWLDDREHVHVLFNCHIWTGTSRHLVSKRPGAIDAWAEAPCLATSISYPRVLRSPNGPTVLYYRALGHMGYWTYRLSHDGGATWEPPVEPIVDFDFRPEEPGDEWAGSYHSVVRDADGRHLHLAMVRWDERHRINPLYKRFVNLWSRYDLYYAKLDLLTGTMTNIDGRELERPLNRRLAREHCLVWETGEQLTNMPSMLIDPKGRPQFLLPVAGRRLDRCRLWFIRRHRGSWQRHAVAEVGNIWNGSHLSDAKRNTLSAFIVRGSPQTDALHNGGGRLEEWQSTDRGVTWRRAAKLAMPDGVLVNNPKPIEDALGTIQARSFLFFGWEGPLPIPRTGPYTGQAYLWRDGDWL